MMTIDARPDKKRNHERCVAATPALSFLSEGE
jgi:hypothetical protein